MKISIKGKVSNIVDYIKQYRRELHEQPELSGEEVETSKRIQEQLTLNGIPYKTGFADTGVLGIIQGGKPGKTVALRADIDALPITEKTDLPFSSKVEGKMHACGHDAHNAMLLGAGILLNQVREEMEGTVLLVFQPAEEDSPKGGAQQMMEDGVFDDYKPDVMIGQHVWPDLPVGQFGILPGPMMGNSDKFRIVINGSGGHASMPHQTIDAIIVANQVITALQTIVSRNVDPIDSAVITIGKIEGGVRHNVVADQVTLEGTVRTLSNEVKGKVKSRFFSIVEGVTEAMDAGVEIEYMDGYPATVNTPEWVEVIKNSLANQFGESSVPAVSPSLGGEDFGRFLLKYPGAYYWLGSSVGENQKPLHDPRFIFNEEALAYGIEGMAQAALDIIYTLNEKAGE
ncbi:M20 metallopeptidase family protein [Bacillus sp. PS06]|uniref:M20 metallopeptidase family protein n=1 Tax=Bacillus sp. PS06 TaxID=2764176 RepID=UPI00177BD4B7|nr:M20 family metallopeptidase [Bacillus sp. PS06]MBD8071205.1 amidohydrolase [Bacillus sp. PS06]